MRSHLAAPTPALPPSRVVIVDDIPQDWWEVALLWMTGIGTLLAAVIAGVAVVFALRAGDRDRRAADDRARQDRVEFDRRQAEEREHDRRLADSMWRLDLLLRINEAHQALLAAPMPSFRSANGELVVERERARARAALTALVNTYPNPLPVLWHLYLFEDTSELDPAGELMTAYSGDYHPPATDTEEAHTQALAAAELRYTLRQVRSRLMDERFISGLTPDDSAASLGAPDG